ncbi:MAG: glutathione S-transferase [Gammaproteobacteria bacterium]|jgi:glutathione S-transferase
MGERELENQAKIVVWGQGTPRTLRVYWALHELNLDYHVEPIITRTAAMDSQEFLTVSPGKKIPAIEHDSLTLTESGAITRFLMETYSDEVWTIEQKAKISRWSFFALMEIDATALYVIRRHEGLPNIYGEAPAAISSSYLYVDRQLDVLNELLVDGRSYVVGDKFSEADIHLGSCLIWARLLKIELPMRVAAYCERLVKRDAYQQASTANRMPASL